MVSMALDRSGVALNRVGRNGGSLPILRPGLALALVALASIWAAPAHAEKAVSAGQEGQQEPQQEPPAQEQAEEKQAGQEPSPEDRQRYVDEVTVTARRVEERLQDIPISVTAFAADELDLRQTFTTELLDQVTPNLQFSSNSVLAGNNSASTIVVRGIGQIDPTSSVDPGVGLYMDDVYFGQSIGGTMEFRDIRSVQVLRGPQGTLFGRNTVGGAILLTTNQPGDKLGGSFRGGYGSDNLRHGFLALDVPFSERFKSRFTAGIRQREGYVIRALTGEDLGDTDTFTGTAKFSWRPTGTFQANLAFDVTNSDENGNPFVFAAINEAATFPRVASANAGCPGVVFPVSGPVPQIADDRCANDLQNKGPFTNNGTYPLESTLDNWGTSLRLSLQASDRVTFKSISSYRSLDWTGIRDADNTPLAILHTEYDSDGEQLSQELQMQYSAAKLKGTLGVYYIREDTTDIVYVQLNDPVPGIQEDSDNNITENSSWAVFSQWSYDFAPKLSLTLGGRYTEDTKGSTPDQFNYANPSNKYLPVRLYEATFDAFTFSGSVGSRWNANVMTYLSYSEGFKGGGWNSHFNTCQVLDPCANGFTGPALANAQAAAAVFPLVHRFGPEEARTIELGFKTDLADRRLRLNGAVFTTDYTDLQFTYRSGVAPYLANAGKASIDGFEVEMTWVPTPGLQINGGFGYLDSRVDELRQIAGTAVGVAVGNVLPFAPETQANLGASYHALAGGYTISPRVDLFRQGETFFDANNTVEIAQTEPFTVLNASVELAPLNGRWRLTVGGSNLTDELYATGGNSSLTTGSGYAEVAFARPREFFANVGFKF